MQNNINLDENESYGKHIISLILELKRKQITTFFFNSSNFEVKIFATTLFLILSNTIFECKKSIYLKTNITSSPFSIQNTRIRERAV